MLRADQRLGEPAACRWFLNFFDDTPRDRLRAELLPEVEREIARRAEPARPLTMPADLVGEPSNCTYAAAVLASA